MDCPHCQKPLELPVRVVYNVNAYHKTRKSITECCGKIVLVSLRIGYTVQPVEGCTEDDWGRAPWECAT